MTERAWVILLGLLVLFNFAAALACTIDWTSTIDRLHRLGKWARVTYEQSASPAERRALVYVRRGLWLWVLVWVGWKGW
jgi:hypothetical protein